MFSSKANWDVKIRKPVAVTINKLFTKLSCSIVLPCHLTKDSLLESSIFPSSITLGTTERVSVATDSTQGNNWSGYQSISVDGRFAAFESPASNLVSGDTSGAEDVFIRDRGTTTSG